MALWDEPNIELSAKVCTHYNKNNYAHVTTQKILNKFIEINFSVGCMYVWFGRDVVYSKIDYQ